MRPPPPPLRFVGGVLLLWIAGRVWMLLPPAMIRSGPIVTRVLAATPVRREGRGVPPPPRAGIAIRATPSDRKPAAPLLLARAEPVRGGASFALEPAPHATPPTAPAGRARAPFGESIHPSVVEPASAALSRWSGDAYLFARPGGGPASLAAGGVLGGSQIAARLAYALNREGPPRIAIAARAYAPLDAPSGSEGALGIDWHPFPRAALRLSAERRFDAGGKGRNAWSAYAAGGVYKGGLPGGLEADLYAQAGVVGARRGDLFVDGALRVARPIPLDSRHVLRLGVAAWGAAQPEVARLDVGPRVALGLPIGRMNVTAALDYRARLLGSAAPGSGLAFTLAAGF